MLFRTIGVALSLHILFQAPAALAEVQNTNKTTNQEAKEIFMAGQTENLETSKSLKNQMQTWAGTSLDANLKSQLESFKTWPTMKRQGNRFVFTLNDETVTLEILDFQSRKVLINGKSFVFDSQKTLAQNVDAVRFQIFTPRKNVFFRLLFPEAHAFVPALAFLSANAWGPLMVGIAMSGVFADFALRPMVENTVTSLCGAVAESPRLLNFVGGLNRDGVCRNYFKAQAANSCMSPDRSLVEYTLENADQTFTKWVASLDSAGKVTGIKELQLDHQQKSVLRTPIEYRMRNEDLAEVKLTPMTSMKPSNLRVSQAEQWASYQVIASLMRTAASLCQPGKYDELLRAARNRRGPEVDPVSLRQSSRQPLTKSNWAGS